jgi:hypothetical protein
MARYRQFRQTVHERFSRDAAAAAQRDADRAGTFVAGDRVVDLVTGEEGEVVYGTRENIVVHVAER